MKPNAPVYTVSENAIGHVARIAKKIGELRASEEYACNLKLKQFILKPCGLYSGRWLLTIDMNARQENPRATRWTRGCSLISCSHPF